MTSANVVAAIIHRDGLVLAARRADEGQGGWEFPGGKVEKGETPERALERELMEELGCEVASAWPFDTVSLGSGGEPLTMECLVCRLADGSEPARDERVHSELRWVSREELGSLDWMPADETVARKVAYYWDETFSDQQL